MRYRLPDGRYVNSGQNFESEGRGFPANWLELTPDEEKAKLGIVADPAEEQPQEPPKSIVQTTTILARLLEAGLLEQANAALESLKASGPEGLYTYQRWYKLAWVYCDAPEAVALCKAIGADPKSILAPG